VEQGNLIDTIAIATGGNNGIGAATGGNKTCLLLRHHIRFVFRKYGRIQSFDLLVGSPLPDFVLSEQRDAEIAAHRKGLTIRAQRHPGVVDAAIARIEDIAVIVSQALPLHAADTQGRRGGQ
jgi:hypothetical protein